MNSINIWHNNSFTAAQLCSSRPVIQLPIAPFFFLSTFIHLRRKYTMGGGVAPHRQVSHIVPQSSASSPSASTIQKMWPISLNCTPTWIRRSIRRCRYGEGLGQGPIPEFLGVQAKYGWWSCPLSQGHTLVKIEFKRKRIECLGSPTGDDGCWPAPTHL